MDQIKCPVCTLLNPRTNTNCDVCDSPLTEGTSANNPLEDQFMQLTGESRSKAQEYLKVTSNDLDKAVGLFYQDQEMGVTNQQIMNQHNMFNNLIRSLTTSLRQSAVQLPKNTEELVCQTLYRRGRNTPHHCAMCDSKAFLICIKMISYKDSVHDIIKFMAREDLELMKITELADLGLLMDKAVNQNHELALPNKLFDYMHANTPVLSNQLTEIEKFIRSNDIGVVINDPTPKGISKAIMDLKQDNQLLEKLKENCMKTALTVNWNNEKTRLITAIKTQNSI